ncbi:hypothetical protein [Tenacibaculum xiamenense]|uniref:hypothetical protein n=1 Tax=Tenacibaculum xiamenense TaxID=1261553 RepID=UPI0038B5D90E
MKRKRIFLFLAFFIFLINQTTSQVLDSYIREQFSRIRLIALPDFDIQLEIVDEGKMESLLASRKVIFSKSELNKFSKEFNQLERNFLIQILLAHEVSHQFQFNWYKGKKELQNRPILRMLLEGQADVLAGFCFGHMLIDDLDKLKKSAENINIMDSFYKVFQFILDVGIEESSIGTHPSKTDRLMLIRQGMNLGAAKAIDMDIKRNPHIAKQYFITSSAYQKEVEKILKGMDFDNSKDNIFKWSYRVAKRIMNYNPKVAQNIVLLKDKQTPKIHWHKSQEYPYVDYEFNYLNISEKPIDVAMEIYISHVDRNNPQMKKYQNKRNSKIYSFHIKPKEIKTIKGKLNWDKFDNDYDELTSLKKGTMPRIVYPHANSDEYIMSASFSKDETTQLSKDEINYLAAIPSPNATNTKYKLGSKIKKIIRTLKYNRKDLAFGIGNYYPLNQGAFIEYKTALSFDKNCSIEVFKNIKDINQLPLKDYSDEIYIRYPYFKMKEDASNKFKALIEAFDLALPNYEKEDDNDGNSISVSYNLNNIYVDLYLEKNRKTNIWEIEIEIYN